MRFKRVIYDNFVAFVVLALVFMFLPASTRATSTLTECKFSSFQVFDVQWSISNGNLYVSGVTAPYDTNFQQPTTESGDYYQFFDSATNTGTYGLKLFNSDGSLQQVMHDTGNFSAIGSDFIFYQGSGFYGTVFTTTQGLAYGSSAVLSVTEENPTNQQVASTVNCSSAPIEQVGSTTTTTVSENTSTTTTAVPQGMTSMPNAGFENNSFSGWNRGQQPGSLGSTIVPNGTGVSIFSGTRTFTHGSRNAVGNPTLPNGAPNPYYAPAVHAGSWTFGPSNGTYAALLQPANQQTFSQAMAELGLSGSSETQLRGTLTSQAQASGFGGGNPTDAAWITREVQLTAGVTYTMNWNYVGTDYVPFNDGSVTSLVAVTTPSSPTITVNNSVGTYALLGFTNPGTGDYSTNSFGSTGWQISTYKVSVTGTYKLGFAVFNLDDTSLSPALMIDNVSGTTERCVPAGSNCVSFGGVVSNNPTAPTVVVTTTTTTPPTTTTTVPATSLVVTSNDDDGSQGTLRWAITQANSQNGGIYDTITFAGGLSGTITLTSSLPAIVGSLTITGNGQTNTVIDGNGLYRPFWIGQGNSLTVSHLTLKKGINGDGGLIFNTKGTISATNVRFTEMSGGAAVFNKEAGSIATYTNCMFDYLNIGISADHGSTPSLPSGITTWAEQPDSVFQNRTYVNNSTFSNNGAGINSQRFTKVQNSTFTNNSYGAAMQGWNRSQVLNSTFSNNGIGIYHNSWISPTANMGTDNRLIEGNTFTNNGTAIYLDDTYNNGRKYQGWSTVRNNTWDEYGNWVVYYLWNGSSNSYGSVTYDQETTVFSQSLNTSSAPPTTTTTTSPPTTVLTPLQPLNPQPSTPVETTTPPQTTTVPVSEDDEPPLPQDDQSPNNPSQPSDESSDTAEEQPQQEPEVQNPSIDQQTDASETTLPDDATSQILDSLDNSVSAEDLSASVAEILSDLDSTEVVGIIDSIIEAVVADKPVDELTDEDKEKIVAVVAAVIESGITEDVAEQLASNPAVLASVETSQAEAVFEQVDAGALTDEVAEAIVDAVQDAPSDIREVFEDVVDLFQGAFDEYTMLGSTINVGQRRTVVAVTALTTAISGAMAAGGALGGSPTGGSSPSSPSNPNDAARREDEEEEASGEIAGDGVEWIKKIRIFKYVDGVRVVDWKAFSKKFGYGVMNLGFTLAGSLVVYLTLSGPIQIIAGLSTVAAFGAAMWLHMKEPEGE